MKERKKGSQRYCFAWEKTSVFDWRAWVGKMESSCGGFFCVHGLAGLCSGTSPSKFS